MKKTRKPIEEFLQEIVLDKVNLKKVNAGVKKILKPFAEKNIVKSFFEDGSLRVVVLFPEEGKRIDCMVQSGFKR